MRAFSSFARAGTALLFVSLLPLGCADGGGPTLQEISNQSVRVNEELRLTIGIDNPDGRAVSLRIEDPMLPSFDRVHSLSTEPGGAVFRWAPLSSQTGTHELTFVLTDGGGGTEYDRTTALFEVLPSADAAPIFIRPSAGGTFDLERDPCVTFDVEVRDDDSSTVEIGTRAELPERATLANSGAKTATFDWCPTPDQVGSSERWTVQLFADDGDHPRVEHDYIIVLRSGPKEGCPGAEPVVTVDSPRMGEAITSGTTYPVEATVTDDMGLRDAPLLYYSLTAPADPTKPDVTTFEQATFAPAEGDSFVARIPNLGLAEGEMREVFFLVSATDNDDPSGSICDHRTDSQVVSFFAVGGMPPDGSLRQCDFCTSSTECESSICAATAAGGRCVDSCSGDGVCAMGSCGATVTTEGGARAGCGPARDICGGGSGGTCTDDGREDNDTVATATMYAGPYSDGQICAGDDDWFRFSVPSGNRLTVTVSGAEISLGDLDLSLQDSSGTIVDTSAGVSSTEMVEYCNSGSTATFYARVFGYGSDENSYMLGSTTSPDAAGCCMDDAGENDDTQATARTVTFASDVAAFDGTVCPGDSDWIAIPMTGPGRIEVDLVFTHASGDIDMTLHDPSGTRIASGLSVTDDESIGIDVSGGGTYALRVYGFSRGNDYLGEVRRIAGAGCTTTLDCPLDTVCETGSCGDDRCTSMGDCPPMHTCMPGGPIPAASHCAATCTTNTQCRSAEACKWFASGRGCGRTGSRQNGDSCASYASCGGQRACHTWPGGYCARLGCTSNADCESGTWCVTEGGVNVCALSCVSASCRDAEGYSCRFRPTNGGTDRFVCVPS